MTLIDWDLLPIFILCGACLTIKSEHAFPLSDNKLGRECRCIRCVEQRKESIPLNVRASKLKEKELAFKYEQ